MAEENDHGEEGKGFKVSDRRFSVRGYEEEEEPASEERVRTAEEPRAPAPETTPAPSAPPEDQTMREEQADAAPEGEGGREFETLLAILQGNALAAMGLHPQTGERVGGADPRAAKMMVDLLNFVHGKMQGNLSAQEEKLISQVLSDLRMIYVQQVGIG